MTMLLVSSRISFPMSYLLQFRKIRRPNADVYQCFIQKDLYTAQASSVLIISGKYLLNIDKKWFNLFWYFYFTVAWNL